MARINYHVMTVVDRKGLAEQLVQLGACPEIYNGRSRCTYDEPDECFKCMCVWLEEPEKNKGKESRR